MIAESGWLRASQVQKIMGKEMGKDLYENNIEDIGMILGMAMGFLTGACVSILVSGQVTALRCTMGGSLGAFAGLVIVGGIGVYVDSPDIALQHKQDAYLKKKFVPYEIVRGEDLAYILEILSPEAQKKILNKTHPAQLKNSVDKISDVKLKALVQSDLSVSSDFNRNEEVRIILEKESLALLAHNLDKKTSDKCREIFGKSYPKIANSFLQPQIDVNNVHKIHAFAEENQLKTLMDSCDRFVLTHQTALFYESKKSA